MVTHANRTAGTRKPALLLASALVMLLVIPAFDGCQFLGMDMFPTTLSREDAVLDIDAKLADLGVTGNFEIALMRFATSPATGRRYVLVRIADAAGTPRLLVLDGDDLSLVSSTNDPAIAYGLGIDERNFLVSAYPPSPTDLYFYKLPNFTDPEYCGLAFDVPPETEMGASGGGFMIFRYSPDTLPFSWLQTGAIVNDPATPPSVGLVSGQMRSAYYEGGPIGFLFADDASRKTYIIGYSGKTELLAATSPMLTDPTATVAVIPSGDDGSGWLTRNGAIILTHDNETRLVRYESHSGKELDSFALNDTEDTRFAFSPDGKKWLMYDGAHGKLHLLRTWW